MVRWNVMTCAVIAALAAACSSKPKPAPNFAVSPATDAKAATTAAAAAPKQAPDVASPSSGSVHIEDRITKACGDLPQAHFAFDSTRIESDAAAALDALARCFSTGPLKGRELSLIGHADPRGEFDYNMGLGQRRAGSVAEYLSSKGVERRRISPSSRGELEAVGTDEQGWARDRKVDVLLAN